MKKILRQLLPVITLIFAAVMMAQEQGIGPAIRIGANGQTENCVDVWSATRIDSVAFERSYHTAVWTGTEMIVWGGMPTEEPFSRSGRRYDPGTDSWTIMSLTNAPTGRFWHTAVWTGTEMIVWGGYDFTNSLNTGGRYNPATDTWTAMSTTNAPSARSRHTAVWTGSEMIIWGGGNNLSTGGKYNPTTDTWTPVSNTQAPPGRAGHTAVWTGSEMIVWGGSFSGTLFNNGRKYNPSTDTWTATSTVNAPAGRRNHTAVWTGSEMIVWSGYDGADDVNSGGKYNPGTDTWAATSTTNAPGGREDASAIWTGSEMIAWGGLNTSDFLNTGGRYNPATDTWTLTTTSNATAARANHTAVWTGSQMIVWGGSKAAGRLNTGGLYCVGPFENTCEWSSAPAYPVETYGGGITSLGDYIYSFGGGTSASLTTAYKFDGVSWTPIAPLPSPEAFPSAVNDGTNIYLVGGNVSKYDPVTDTYTPLARYHVETTGHRAVYLDGKIYKMCGVVPGGQTPEGSNALEIYDIATDTWTNGTIVPYAAAQVSAFAFGNYVYAAGGMLLPPNPTSLAFEYDPSINSWGSFFPFLPEARTDAAVAVFGNGVVLAGGANQSFQILDSALFWDSASNQWINLPAMLTPRTGGIGAVLKGSFYFVGGRADLTANGTTTNQKLSCTSLPPPSPTPTPTIFPSPTPTATTTPGTPTPTIPPPPSPTPTPFGNTCGWSSAPAYPVETFGGGITSLGNYIYSFGGDTSASVTKAYKFNGVSWTAIAPLPYPEGFPSAVNDGTNIYLVGNTVWKYNPVTDTYTSLAQYNVSTNGHKAVYLGGKIYKMCGGMPGGQAPKGSDDLEIYDIATNTWTSGPPVPFAAISIAAFTFGNYVYVAGGMLLPPSVVNNAYRYDPSTNAWDNGISFLPEARSGSAVASYGNGVVLAGGTNQSFQILDSALFWDAASNQWLNLPATLTPRQDGMGAVLNGSFYFVGGRSDFTANGTTTNQKLSCTSIPTPTPTPYTPTPTPTATPAGTPIFANISTRGRVEFGPNVLIGGFVVTGTQPKKVIVRALGPSLPFPGVVANPYLELRNSSGTLIRANDNWRDQQEAEIIATTIPPGNDLESAIVATLPANGAAYTAAVSGLNVGTGIGVVEVYDLDQAASSKLANISTRGLVQTGDDVLIGGLIIRGQTNTMRVILRAIGPSLPVPDALANPKLELRDSNGGLIASNDNWRSDQEAEIIATTVPPTNELESAIVLNLPPGTYTSIVSGAGNTMGVGLVEAYNLSN